MSTPQSRSRSNSRSRTGNLPSRPTTPLRPSSRASLRASLQAASTTLFQNSTANGGQNALSSSASDLSSPLDLLEPQLAELSDGMADLEANMLHLQIMTESLSRFEDSFASFLYGLGMNAFCVDWMEMPGSESFKIMDARNRREAMGIGMAGGSGGDGDATFLTTDTSFVEHPPMSTKSNSKVGTPRSQGGKKPAAGDPSGTGTGRARGRGIPRASGIARGSGRGSGVGRGARGR